MIECKRKMDAVDFVTQLIGVIPVFQAKEIYKNISHYPESKKNLIIDLLKVETEKYKAVLLYSDD